MNINAMKNVLLALLLTGVLLVMDGCGKSEGEAHKLGNLSVSFWVEPILLQWEKTSLKLN